MRALLVVDMDSGNGWGGSGLLRDSEQRGVVKGVRDALKTARATNIPILFAMYPTGTNTFTGQEAQTTAPYYPEKCLGCDHDVIRLAKFLHHQHDPFEPVFIKKEISAFSNNALVSHLRKIGADELLLAGCYTNVCIETTATGALHHGISVILLRNSVCQPFKSKGEEEVWLWRVTAGTIVSDEQRPYVSIWERTRETVWTKLERVLRR